MQCWDCPNRVDCWKAIENAIIVGCPVALSLGGFLKTVECAKNVKEEITDVENNQPKNS